MKKKEVAVMSRAFLNSKKIWSGLGTTAKSLLSLLTAMILGGIILAAVGYNPFSAYGHIFNGAFGSSASITNTLIQMTPLIFTGLAFVVALKSGIINLGLEGQMFMGALVSGLIGMIDFGLPAVLHVTFAVVTGVVAGSLYALLAAFFKVRFGANEFIVTLMMNYVAINFAGFLSSGPLRAEGAGTNMTEPVLETALLPKLVPNRGLTIAIIIGVLAVFAVHMYLKNAKGGFEIRTTGMNSLAAQTAGISTSKVTLKGMAISGAIAGMAGVAVTLGVTERFVHTFSPGYGFDGIAISALAGGNPLGIIPAALIFGGMRSGSMIMNLREQISPEFSDLIQALVVLFVAMPYLFSFVTKKKKGGTR